MATTTRTQNIYTLVRPTWLDAAGMGKGINHDRQHLGLILGANQTINVRQTNPDFSTPLVARLLNNDRDTEISLNIGSDWTSLTTTVASVPFIDTPYIDGSPRIEFEYPDDSKILPVYNKGDDEPTFISQWENQAAEYSLIDSTFTRILVPAGDINNVKDLQSQGGIDGLIDFYESLFTSFNSIAGLSFEPAQPTDLNIANRYFMKLDKHGAGGAYYGTYYTAQSVPSTNIKKFWLSPDTSNWGCAHEIGHGYQGKFGSDTSFYTGEIWNNIYVVYWQDTMDPQARYNENGLYDGEQEFFEWTIQDELDKRNPVANWGLGQRNYFFILMIDAAGVSAFTHFNQLYRKNINSADFIPENHLILDMLADSLATSGNRIDVVPFMQLWGAPISTAQRERNLYSGANAVYSLNGLFKCDALLEQQSALGLDTAFDLVKVEQLNSQPAPATFRLKLTIDDFSQINGCTFIVMDGDREVHQHIITKNDTTIPALPVGAYSLRLPFGKNKKYQPSTEYLIVKDGNNQYTINFTPRNTSSLATQKIWLLGAGNWSFGWMLLDASDHSIKLAITKVDPHPNYPEFYARIGIKNLDGLEFFFMEIPGKGADIQEIHLPYKPGYQIEVIHSQSGGFKTTVPDIINSSTNNQTWNITPFGFENVALSTDIQANYLLLIENMIKELRNDPVRHTAACFTKVEIYLALQAFESPEREELMKKYADCLPLNNEAPDKT